MYPGVVPFLRSLRLNGRSLYVQLLPCPRKLHLEQTGRSWLQASLDSRQGSQAASLTDIVVSGHLAYGVF